MMGWLVWLSGLLILYIYWGRRSLVVGELANKQGSGEDNANQLFVEFVDKYDKPYKFDTDEYNHRFEVFKVSMCNWNKVTFVKITFSVLCTCNSVVSVSKFLNAGA